jgi:hypothetical protein
MNKDVGSKKESVTLNCRLSPWKSLLVRLPFLLVLPNLGLKNPSNTLDHRLMIMSSIQTTLRKCKRWLLVLPVAEPGFWCESLAKVVLKVFRRLLKTFARLTCLTARRGTLI